MKNIISISEKSAIGFMPKCLVLATLPHSKPKSSEFIRKNGDYTLTLYAPTGEGLPYGVFPRLLLVWMVSQALKTKDPKIMLGKNLSAFLKSLNIARTGANIRQLRSQLKKLVGAVALYTHDDGSCYSGQKLSPVEGVKLWGMEKEGDKSFVVLGAPFFQEILTASVPVCMQLISKIRKSPLAIDLYCWLTYRVSYLKKPIIVPWRSLQAQFGGDYANTRQGLFAFKKEFDKQIKKVLSYYPVNVVKSQAGLTVYPSSTHVKRLPVDN